MKSSLPVYKQFQGVLLFYSADPERNKMISLMTNFAIAAEQNSFSD